jgi:hypothetical protein
MPHNASQWFAQRSVQGVGEDGAAERVTIWIERKPGAVWAVGRAIDLAQRTNGAIRDDDYVFEGFEMGDALEAANDALASDLEVSLGDGRVQDIQPFADSELLQPLERWFFGQAPG